MKVIETYPFQFADSVFPIYLTDQRLLLIPLRQLCDALGLSFASQLNRAKRDVIISKHLHIVRADVQRGDASSVEQDVACIASNRLDYWMGGIDHERVKPELREKVILYKEEMADALHAYFRSQRFPEDMLAELDAALPPREREFHQAMDSVVKIKKDVDDHKARISGLEERMVKLEDRLVGTTFLTMQQAKQLLDAVATLAALMKEAGREKRNPFPVIHGKIQERFRVPSYYLIPEKDFPEVLKFLADLWRREAPGRPVPEIFSVHQDRLI